MRTIGAVGLGYALWEAHSYRLRRAEIPVLPTGAPDLRVLHVSDLHLTPALHGRVAWVRRLRELRPDLVVVTGDFLALGQAKLARKGCDLLVVNQVGGGKAFGAAALGECNTKAKGGHVAVAKADPAPTPAN